MNNPILVNVITRDLVVPGTGLIFSSILATYRGVSSDGIVLCEIDNPKSRVNAHPQFFKMPGGAGVSVVEAPDAGALALRVDTLERQDLAWKIGDLTDRLDALAPVNGLDAPNIGRMSSMLSGLGSDYQGLDSRLSEVEGDLTEAKNHLANRLSDCIEFRDRLNALEEHNEAVTSGSPTDTFERVFRLESLVEKFAADIRAAIG